MSRVNLDQQFAMPYAAREATHVNLELRIGQTTKVWKASLWQSFVHDDLSKSLRMIAWFKMIETRELSLNIKTRLRSLMNCNLLRTKREIRHSARILPSQK